MVSGGQASAGEPNQDAATSPAGDAGSPFTLMMVADVPAGDVDAFQAYEAEVLPLLQTYGGLLEGRWRSPSGEFEAHIITFQDRDGYEAYVNDPVRARARTQLPGSGLRQRLEHVVCVEVPRGTRSNQQESA